MSGESPGEITEVRYLIRPNRSMDGRQAALVVLLVAAVSFVLAGGSRFATGRGRSCRSRGWKSA
ncbi:MAG: hypothetical protein M5U09_09465 [Gammaproteobacteria bacterium]|nr:hypothetical protein [Gammaproteobacteria bacterium]